MSQSQLGGPIALTYGMAACGSLLSGALFPALLKRGFSVNRARKTALVFFACCVLPLPLALYVGNAWAGAAVLGLAMFAHNGFAISMFGMTADMVPLQRVGTVMAMGSVASNLSGVAMIELTGWSLIHGHGYWPIFAIAAVAYLLAVGWVQLLAPVIKPASEDIV